MELLQPGHIERCRRRMAGESVEGSRCVGRVKLVIPRLESGCVLDRGTRRLVLFVVSLNSVNSGMKHTRCSLSRRTNDRMGI
jgi:hypothetical protein